MGLLNAGRKNFLFKAVVIAIAFTFLPASMEAMMYPYVGQYLGAATGVVVAFLLAMFVLWFIKKTERHVP